MATKFALMLSIIAFTACGGNTTKESIADEIEAELNDEVAAIDDATEESKGPDQEEIFNALREMSLGTKPSDLGLEISDESTTVFGMVMDWEIGGGVASVVAFSTGDASVYINKGGSVLGGGQHAVVNAAAKKYIGFSQDWLEKATPTETTPLPATDEVIFYFITNKGVYSGKTNMGEIEGGNSEWMPLFEEANLVLGRLRETAQAM